MKIRISNIARSSAYLLIKRLTERINKKIITLSKTYDYDEYIALRKEIKQDIKYCEHIKKCLRYI